MTERSCHTCRYELQDAEGPQCGPCIQSGPNYAEWVAPRADVPDLARQLVAQVWGIQPELVEEESHAYRLAVLAYARGRRDA